MYDLITVFLIVLHLFSVSLFLLLCFLPGEVPLAFVVKLVWWCWILFSSVQSLSHVQLFATPWAAAHQVSLSITNCWTYSDSFPLSQSCHPTISSCVIPFSYLQSFPASGSFQMSQLFVSGGQSIGASASVSVLSMNIQDWFPLGLTGLISLQSKGLSKGLLQHHSSKASNSSVLSFL